MSREEIIAANPIVDFVRSRGHELKRAGQELCDERVVRRHSTNDGHRPVMIYPETQSGHAMTANVAAASSTG